MSIAQSPADKIESHRDDLESLADSDLPVSEIAGTLLEITSED